MSAEGAVFANGVRVTDTYGWIELATLASARARGAPASVLLRLSARVTPQGRFALFAGELRVAGRSYAGVAALDTLWAVFWSGSLEAAVRAEIERRIEPARSLPRRPSSGPVSIAEHDNTPVAPSLPRRATASRTDPPRATIAPPSRPPAVAQEATTTTSPGGDRASVTR